MPTLTDLDHVVFLIAEEVPVDALPALDRPVVRCPAYRPTPAGEDRADRLWPAYAVALRDADYTVHLRYSMPDTIGDVTVVEARQTTVETVLAELDALPASTLLAVGLADSLLLCAPWIEDDATSDEVCDHASLMLFCEAWTAARGRAARVVLPASRLEGLGDLVGALDLTTEPEPDDVDEGEDAGDE